LAVVLFHLNTVRYVMRLRKISKKYDMTGHVTCTGREKRCRLGVVQKFEGQRPYRRPRHRRNYNIENDLK